MKTCLLSCLAVAFFLSSTLPCPAAEPAGKELSLFDGKSLDDWEVKDAGGSGTVEAKDGTIVVGTGESITGLIYKNVKDLPVTNYEITLEAMRVEGLDFFCGLTFPVGSLKSCATLVLGGWSGSVTGISDIDGLSANENSTGHYRKWEDKKWHKIKLQVTPETIKAWANGEEIIDVDIAGKKIAVRYGPIEDYQPLSLTTYQTTGAFRNIKIKPLPPVEKKP